MKTHPNLSRFTSPLASLSAVALLLLGAPGVQAQFSWQLSGNGSGSWANQSSWGSSATLPTTTSSSADFSQASITANSTVTLDANQGIQSLTFGYNNATNWTFTPGAEPFASLLLGSGASVTVGNAGQVVTLNVPLAGSSGLSMTGPGTLVLGGANTLSGGLTLNSGQINFNTGVPGTGTITIEDATTIDNTSLAINAVGNAMNWYDNFTFAGTSPLTLSGADTLYDNLTLTVNGPLLNLTGVISGGNSLTKAGAGTVLLGGANTYSGGTVINGGMLGFKTDNIANGVAATLGTTPSSFAPGNIVINGGTLAMFNNASTYLNTNRGLSVGPSSGSGGGTIDVIYNYTLTNDCIIANNGSGTGSLTKTGYGTLILGAANTYSGGTIVNAGTLNLDFTQVGAPGAPTANILNPAGSLTLGGGAFKMTGKAGTANAQTNSALYVSGGGNTITFTPGAGAASTAAYFAGNVTRTSAGALVDFSSVVGAADIATNICVTTAANINGILGGWATVNAFNEWAAVSNNVVWPLGSYGGYLVTIPTTGPGSATSNYQIVTAGPPTNLTANAAMNSLRLGNGGGIALGNNTLTLSGTNGGLLCYGNALVSGSTPGYLTAGSGQELIIITKSGATLTNSAPLIGNADGGRLTVGGAGTMLLSSANTYTGPTLIDGGTLNIASGGSLAGGSSVKVNTGGTLTVSAGGTVGGNVEVGPSTGNTTANLNNSGTISGNLTLDAAEAPASPNANAISQGAPGYALLNTNSTTGNVTNNGILAINGGATTLTSLGTISSPNGLGAIIYNSTVNNTLTLASGSSFSYFQEAASGAVATLQIQGNGPVGIDYFGYYTAVSNYSVTISGGTWNLGNIGQNNSGTSEFVGTANLTGGATVNVQNNNGYDHGAWNMNNGSLNCYGAVAENNTIGNNGLNLSVGASGSLNIFGGGLTLGMAAANTAPETNSLTVGTSAAANIGGGLTVGTSITQPNPEVNTVTLSGGKLLVNGTIAAGAGTGQTEGFIWTGGQLTATTITTNADFNASGSSLNATTLTNLAGTLAPGDKGAVGKTTINGNYVQGSGATLDLDIAGTTQASLFQTNSGYDYVLVNGTAQLAGNLNVRVAPGFVPAAGTGFTVLKTIAGGLSGIFGNLGAGNTIYASSGSLFTVLTNGTSVILTNCVAFTASFTEDKALALTNQTIHFTDASAGSDITGVAWNFGDGSAVVSSSQGLTVPHVYASPNTYTVIETVTNINLYTTTATNTVLVVNSYRQIVWAGDSIYNNWDSSTANWLSGGTPTMFETYDSVVFNDSGSASPAINLEIQASPSLVTFSNVSKAYTLSGSGGITNVASLHVASGLLTIETVNSYSGSTTIDPGATVTLGNGSGPDGNLSTTACQNNGKLVVDFANPETMANSISGSGALTNLGSGSLTLTGSSTYTGGTTLANGSQLNFGSSSVDALHSPIGTGPLTIQGGTIIDAANGSPTLLTTNAQQWNGDFTFNGSANLAFGPGTVTLGGNRIVTVNGKTLTINGPVAGAAHSLTVVGPGTLALGGTDTSLSSATVTSGNLQIGAGGASGFLPVGVTLAGGNLLINRTDSATPLAGSITCNDGSGNVTNLGTAAGNVTTITLPNGLNAFGTIGNGSPGTLAINASGNSTNYFGGATGGIGVTVTNGTCQTVLNGGVFDVTNQTMFGGVFAGGFSYGTLVVNGATLIADSLQPGSPANGGATFTRCQLAVSNGLLHVTSGGLCLNVLGQRPGVQTMNVAGGEVLVDDSASPGETGFRGMVLSGLDAVTGDAYAGNVTVTQSGGSVVLAASANNNLNMGNNESTNRLVSYQLSGGTVSVLNGGNVVIGAGPTNVNEAAFTLTNSGKLVVSGSIHGYQPNSSALQVFSFLGGTLVAGNVNMTYLQDSTNDQDGTLVNVGGTLAPGDVGTPGQTTITGNYTCSNNAVLAIDIGGATPANAFTNPGAFYDNVSISQAATLAGNLNVSLINGFTPTSGQTFTILTASLVAGTFANLDSNSRVTLASDSNHGFHVTINPAGGTVTLDGYGAPASITPPSATLTNSFNGATLTLSWPSGTGWLLEAQTNSLATGLSNNWFTNTGASNPYTTTPNPAKGTVFYRLYHP